jgi:hypothetical protein
MSQTRGDNLDTAIDNLKSYAVADSTKALYSVGFELYVKFLQLQGQNWSQEQLPPVSEYLLMRFIAFCETQKHLRYSTIKSYLCSIRFFYLQQGGFNPLENLFGKPLPNLRIVLIGLKKKHSNFPKRVRLPITFDILHNMCTLLRKGVFNLFIDSLLEAACVIAFCGFLRCGEFTVLDQFDSDTNLSYNDVQVTNECIFLLL